MVKNRATFHQRRFSVVVKDRPDAATAVVGERLGEGVPAFPNRRQELNLKAEAVPTWRGGVDD